MQCWCLTFQMRSMVRHRPYERSGNIIASVDYIKFSNDPYVSTIDSYYSQYRNLLLIKYRFLSASACMIIFPLGHLI